VIFLVSHSHAVRFAGTATVPVPFQCCHCDGELLEVLTSYHPKLVNALGVGKELVSNVFLCVLLFGMRDSGRLTARQRRSRGLGEFACDTVGLRE